MFDLGSSSYVRDVNAVGVRVADGEVALECERDDHEDGRGHEDLARRGRTSPSKTLSLNTIPISVLIHNIMNVLLTCATMSRYCDTSVRTAERKNEHHDS